MGEERGNQKVRMMGDGNKTCRNEGCEHSLGNVYAVCTCCREDMGNCISMRLDKERQKPLSNAQLAQAGELMIFLQEQMEDRQHPDFGKKDGSPIGKDGRCTTEYLMLNMCWNEAARIFYQAHHFDGSTLKLHKRISDLRKAAKLLRERDEERGEKR